MVLNFSSLDFGTKEQKESGFLKSHDPDQGFNKIKDEFEEDSYSN